MKNGKTCMVTGHRSFPPEKTDYIEEQLRQEILLAIKDGCTRFISGFAQGADLIFADIVAELKQIHPIQLEAVYGTAFRSGHRNL